VVIGPEIIDRMRPTTAHELKLCIFLCRGSAPASFLSIFCKATHAGPRLRERVQQSLNLKSLVAGGGSDRYALAYSLREEERVASG
jgi:hypothetical protein